MADATYGEPVTWQPAAPRFRVLHLILFWVIAAVAVLVAGVIVPGVTVGSFGGAFVAAILIAASQPVYFAGDTDLFDAMAELRGSVALALLPVWGWGPRLGPGHLDPERAARAAAMIAPEVAIPIHWGTFAPVWPGGRLADPARPAREFERLTNRYAPSVEVRVLAPGGRTVI